MNSTQQSIRMSRASRVRVRGGGRISEAIFVTVAGGGREGVSEGFWGGGLMGGEKGMKLGMSEDVSGLRVRNGADRETSSVRSMKGARRDEPPARGRRLESASSGGVCRVRVRVLALR